MGNIFAINKNVFHWEYTEEPHKSRRIEILAKYPQIKRFMKCNGDRRVAIFGILLCILQIMMGFINQCLPHAPMRFLFISCIGTWPATLIMLHIHEAAHGVVFGANHVWKNRIYGIFMNISLGLPVYSFFKKHHKHHHKALGDEILDAEYPSEFEASFFPKNPIGKFLWLLADPMIYAVRTPVLMVRRFNWDWDFEEMLNLLVIFGFDVYLFISDRAQVANYMLCSAMMACQTNMFGFWGLMSHTEFLLGRETLSYYGWLNRVYLNFGYHVEHHDFPGIPSRFLPEVHEIGAEYYEDQFELNSFVVAAIKFIFDDKIGVQSRLKRPNRAPQQFSYDGSSNYRKFPLIDKLSKKAD